jgi:hypothetical protein
MIQNLLDFKSHVDDILSTSFEKNEMLANTVKESFENAINSRQNKPAELIAKYIDGLMRSSKREDTEVETALDKCLILFRYVQGSLLPCRSRGCGNFIAALCRERRLRSILQERSRTSLTPQQECKHRQ